MLSPPNPTLLPTGATRALALSFDTFGAPLLLSIGPLAILR